MRIVRDFFRHHREPPAQQTDIEPQMSAVSVLCFLMSCEKIEEQRRHSGVAQYLRDCLVARTAPAAPAAVRKQNQATRIFRNLEIAGECDFAGGYLQADRSRR